MREQEIVGRPIFGMAVFLLMLSAGPPLVNHFEPCEHGRESPASPCRDPLDDHPSC